MAHQTVSSTLVAELIPTAAGATAAPQEDCPVEVALAAIAGRWTTLLLRNLMVTGPSSYSELAGSLPALSSKVLSERLDQLIRHGLIERQLERGFPSRTSYRLSERGWQLRPLLVELYATGQRLQRSSLG